MNSHRTLILKVGDWWFFRKLKDLYEGLASRYTSKNEIKGIASLYPSNMLEIPISKKYMEKIGEHALYFKDKESQSAFTTPMKNNSTLKIYLVGHSNAGFSTLKSLETNKEYIFKVEFNDLANMVEKICINVNPEEKVKDEKAIKSRLWKLA